MRKLLHRAVSAGAAGCLMLLMASSVFAAPTMMIQAGDQTLVIADNGAGDLNPLDGAIEWSATIGNWSLNVTKGTTKPALGSAEEPYMRLDTFNASSTGGELTIWFTETGYDPYQGELISAYQGLTVGPDGGAVSFETWFDAANTPFGLGTQLLATGSLYLAFGGESSNAVAIGGPYSLTEVIRIVHAGASTSEGVFDLRGGEVAPPQVPEPSVLVFLGLCLLALGIWRTRRA